MPPDQRRPTERHHMPTVKALREAGLDPAKGAVVLIDKADHRELATSKARLGEATRSRQAELIREGRFSDAFDLGVEELKRRLDDTGQQGKYDKAIEEARAYWKCREENGFPSSSGSDPNPPANP